ncbi:MULTISPECIES: capsule assembly Wzi family protein [unclassified Pseudoalteromonas]|uniref:capsule assembly Wzi family protein n=1 Tax=unclassified Pseudoalteromonas TaxID=194690 RepID=UPI003014DBDE
MKLVRTLAAVGLLASGFAVASPTAYLAIGKDPLLEYQIDKMFALTVGTPMAKPYRISVVKRHLDKVKSIDGELHRSITDGIAPYLQADAITQRSITLRLDSGESQQLANDRGNSSSEYAQLGLAGVYRGSDASIFQLGAEYRADSNKLVAYNTFYGLSYGNLQLNLGYKEHWFSPFKHSAQVFSTNAKPSLSASLGLVIPIPNWWNFDFELFYSELEHVNDGIKYQGTLHDGTPKLAGTHFSVEPIQGWKIGINRVMQFGGGPRKVDFTDVVKAYFDPVGNENKTGSLGQDDELGDQWASITSSFTTDWGMPAQWYLEYGGEDTNNHKNYLFGNTVVNLGVYLPKLSHNTTLRYEFTDMESLWYVNEIYETRGNTIDGFGVGHFAANQRQFDDGAPSQIHVLEGTYQSTPRSLWRAKISLVDNDSNYLNELGELGAEYERGYELELAHIGEFYQKQVESKLTLGKDAFGENYTWLSVHVYW